MRTTRTLLCTCMLAITALSPMMVPAADSTASRLAAYRERVARLEDQDAVENLQATFGFFFDKGLNTCMSETALALSVN